ncbi:MAG: DUF3267 domain-containing protein [Ruminococcaceae bacterium]|nr:DUF3267 domain-containing protein [Oscillospiraceae bacterium]
MSALQKLPEGYKKVFSVNLAKDKKIAILINVLALVIAAIMVVIGVFIVPIYELFSMDDGIGMYALRFIVLIVGSIAYIVLHELVHGITMKHFGCKKVHYGFKGFYAYAGCDDYFCKREYIIIALAPVVFWGVVLAVINAFVPNEWFWVVYFVQISNISGAAGDMYVTWKFSKMPKDVLVQDNGVGMTVYSAE